MADSDEKTHCSICRSDLDSALRLSPQDHEREHGELDRACGQCWEAWLSLQVEEKKPSEIECMFCTSHISEDDLLSLARVTTVTRYFMKQKTGFICMARCDPPQLSQAYDRQSDGRVFTCARADCGFQVCVDCDRPEHINETCIEYRSRQSAAHEAEEVKTRKAFKTCPDCTALIKPKKASCHTQCDCPYQFCSACMIPWVDEGSAYLVGKEAHKVGCKYRTRDTESVHSLENRWLQTTEVQHRLDAKKKVQEENRKRKRDETAEAPGKTAGKRKKTGKRQAKDESKVEEEHSVKLKAEREAKRERRLQEERRLQG